MRNSIWNQRFQHFIPLILNKGHARFSEKIFIESLKEIYPQYKLPVADLVLEVIPKMMNSMIVSLMKENLTMQLSEKSLLGYCQFHHMLLYYADLYPSIERKANQTIERFLSSTRNRTKRDVPDLGSFLVLLTLSKHSWKDIAIPLFLEASDRNVRWMLEKVPELETIEHSLVSQSRIEKTFDAQIVSLRLLMFQAYFLSNVSRPKGKSWREMLLHYNETFGTPSLQNKIALHQHCLDIMNVNNFFLFFKYIYVDVPNSKFLTKVLKDSIRFSYEKGYHRRSRYN